VAQPRGPLPAETVPLKPVPIAVVPAEPLPPSDTDLIAASRSGGGKAYDTLYRRHVTAARSLARQLVRGQAEADDVVAETFAKILDLLRRGGGPEGAFRPYLLTAVRRAAYDRHRAERRQVVTDQMEAFDPGVPFADPAVADLERTMIARAFASLPERWQAVLWHTEIEGARPAEVAALLGLTANGVAALAYRAREGLRQAYLQMHLSGAARTECRPVAAKLGAYVRGGLAKRDATMVAGHLDQCADCRRIFAELGDVNVALKAIVAPVILGPAAAAYLASVAARGSAAGWVMARLGQVRHVVKGEHAALVAATVATVTLVTVALAMGGHSRSVSGLGGAPSAPPSVTAPAPAARGASAPVLPAPSHAAAPASHRPGARIYAPAVPPPVSSSLPQTLSQPAPASLAATFAPPAGPPRPVSPPSPATPEPPFGASSAPQAPPAPPASAPPVAPVPVPGPPLVTATIPGATVPGVGVPVVAIPAQGGTSILGLTLTLPVIGVQVSANVSLPGGISLGIGGAPGTPGTTSAGNWTSAG
jgi:RNA polymerase sigma factor (sigma-70 family)